MIMRDQECFYASKLSYEIDSWDLKEKLRCKENVVVIDSRNKESFQTEHIPGATHIPHTKMNKLTTSELNPNALIVVYCDGIGCNASTKGALNMTKLGFNVRELIGGLEWWKREEYPTEGKLGSANLLLPTKRSVFSLYSLIRNRFSINLFAKKGVIKDGFASISN